jgi:RNA-binding protein
MRYLPASAPPVRETHLAELTSKQRAFLRSLAHPLKPILQIGKEGVTDEVASSAVEAFQNRELLKVKVLESAPLSAREAASELSERVDGAHVVQVIGRTVALYRRHPENPEIRLPSGPPGG